MSNINKEINNIITNTLGPETSSFYDSNETSQYSSRKKLDPLYMSSNPKINQSYLVYTSNNHGLNTKPYFDLISPQPNLNLSKHSTEKLHRHIKTITNEIYGRNINMKDNSLRTKNECNLGEGFRNRPVLNLSRKDLDFSSKNILFNSPTSQNVTTSGLFLRRDLARSKINADKGGKKFNPLDFTAKSKQNLNQDRMDHEKFMRDLSGWKAKQYYRYQTK